MRFALLITAFLLFAAPSAQAAWFNSAWDYRIPIEIQASKVGSSTAVTNIPVYVDLQGFPSDFWSNVKSDGSDIRITEADEVTETAFELVNISTASTTGELHFLADSLSTTSNTRFYLYYGNATATAYSATDTYGRNNVWSTYVSVYHIKDAIDSKGVTDLTNVGPIPFTNSGQIGNAGTWAENTDNEKLRTTSNLGIDSASSVSVSTWFFVSQALDGTAGRTAYTIFTKPVVSSDGSIVRALYEYNGGSPRFRMFRLGSTGTFIDRSGTLTPGTWNHAAITWNASTNEVQGFFNGALIATGTNSGTQSISNPGSYQFIIGNNRGDTNNEDKMRGRVDETRVASSALSGSYILTEYNNQSSTSTFYALGAPETDTPEETTVFPQTLFRGGLWSGGTIMQ